MALAAARVRSTSIESREFPELAGRYDVYAVPKIVVNDLYAFTGGLAESQFVEVVLGAIKGSEGPAPEGETTAV